MTKPLALNLTDEQHAMLEELANANDKPPADLAAAAVREWLQYEIEFRKAVRAGLAEADAGLLYDLDDVRAHFASKTSADPGGPIE